MTIAFFVVASLILIFGLVVLVGAPYLPTLQPNVTEALKLTGLKPGQRLLELGSGDGRILLAAARQGIYSVGYEINPLLVLWSKLATWRYRKLVVVKWSNYWLVKWPETDAIYTFLLQKYMKRLDNKIVQTYLAPHRNCPNRSEQQTTASDNSFTRSLVPKGTTNKMSELPVPAVGSSSGCCSSCGVVLGKSIKLVSLAFTIPDKKPSNQVKGLYLYTY